ncbi:hypothetical protein JXL21_10795 [Candidatus Bathyarchaeota archaeon]|nr:hypothetical protein [Candidatus Bathyarchaeota archaeon]
MSEPAEENRRSILEVLYRHRASGHGRLSMEDLRSIEFIDGGRLLGDVEYLAAGGYVEADGGMVGLTEHGFTVMNSREFSFCPHL